MYEIYLIAIMMITSAVFAEVDRPIVFTITTQARDTANYDFKYKTPVDNFKYYFNVGWDGDQVFNAIGIPSLLFHRAYYKFKAYFPFDVFLLLISSTIWTLNVYIFIGVY